MKKGRGVSGRALFAVHGLTPAVDERAGRRPLRRRPPRLKPTHQEETTMRTCGRERVTRLHLVVASTVCFTVPDFRTGNTS
jgi:hypothetical protein